jgi:predicted DNA-binding protein (UPF0251 family)
MPHRNRTLEQLMRSILESQAAMLSAMTQMQQSLLSGMMMPKRDEADGRSDQIKAEEAAHKPEQQAPKPQKPAARLEQQPAAPSRGQAVQKMTATPQHRPSKRTKSQLSWFEKRGESHHLTEHGVSHLRSLFDQGLSQSEAARRMGLTPAAVRRRFHEWGQKSAA